MRKFTGYRKSIAPNCSVPIFLGPLDFPAAAPVLTAPITAAAICREDQFGESRFGEGGGKNGK
jgi:hypothetical protein